MTRTIVDEVSPRQVRRPEPVEGWNAPPPPPLVVDVRRGMLPGHVQTLPVALHGCDQVRDLPIEAAAGLRPGTPVWCHRHDRSHYVGRV